MLNKNLEENQIKIALQEVKDAMKSSHEMGNVLDEKKHSIIKVMLSIIFGLSVFIFVYESSIKILFPSFILMFGAFVSLIILCFSYKSRKYHLYGDLMKNIEKEEFYYHDYKGMLIYLIKTYQIKIEYNTKINDTKGALVDWSIFTAIFFAFMAVIIYFLL